MDYYTDTRVDTIAKELLYFDAIPNPMMCLNLQGEFEWLNKCAISLFGDLPLNEQKSSKFYNWFNRVISDENVSREIELKWNNEKWWHCNCFPVTQDTAKASVFIISMQDVTQRIGVEIALEKSKEKYKRLYNKAPLAFQSLDEKGFLLDVNDQWLHILGYERSEVIGKWIGDFVDSSSLEKLKSKFPEFKSKGYIQDEIFRLRTKNGLVLTVSYDGTIGRKETGEFDRTYCVFKDVTDIYFTRKALKISEEKYRNVVENSNEGICIIQDSCIVFANPKCEELIGYNIEEINTTYFLNYVHPADRNMVTENHFRRLKGDDFSSYDFRLVQKFGGTKWVMFNATLTTFNDQTAVLGFLTDITERKIAEERLREEETKYKLLVENLNDLVCLVDDKGRYTYLNSQYEKRFNYNLTELTGKSAFSFILKEDRAKAKRIFGSLKEGEAHEEVIRFYDPDKGIIWLNCKLNCFKDQEGRRTIEVVSADITESVQFQDKLQASEQRYKSMFHKNGSNMILIEPGSGRFVDINEAALDFLKIDREFNQELVVYDYVVMCKAELDDLIKQIMDETKKHFALKCRLSDGAVREVEVHAGKVEVDGKEMIYAIFNDVSKRKEAEEEIYQNSRRLKSILNIAEYRSDDYKDLLEFTLNEALNFTNSLKGCIYLVNAECGTLSLQCCKSLDGEVFHKDAGSINSFPDFIELNKLLGDGNKLKGVSLKISREICKKLGETRSKHMVVPVMEQDAFVAFIAVARDKSIYQPKEMKQLSLMMGNVWHIIEKQRSREELVVAKVKAEESDRLKSAFLANMSHEIRTPLNAIVGFSNLLSADEMDGAERAKFYEIVERNSEQLLSLIDDIIDVAKIEGLQMRLNPEEIDIKSVLNHVEMNFNELKKRNDKSHLEIKAHYPGEKLLCQLDNYRFNQIFFNLVGNAVKFTNKGRIDFGLKKVNSKELLFFVKDTGVGIEKSKQKVIFGEFAQEDDSVAPRFGGTGLGLTITKRLVELMNGKIWVNSEKGNGATFYFTIPRTEFIN